MTQTARPLWAALAAVILLAAPAATRAAVTNCLVTVVTTDANGAADPDVHSFTRLCKAGETDGSTEYYNPYTDRSRVVPPTQPPLVDLNGHEVHGGTPSSGSQTSSSTTATNCTPAPQGGTKTNRARVQSSNTPRTCPKAGTSPSR